MKANAIWFLPAKPRVGLASGEATNPATLTVNFQATFSALRAPQTLRVSAPPREKLLFIRLARQRAA